MEAKELTITPPEGYEIDKDNSTFEKIVFKPVAKKRVTKWEDFATIDGYYIDGYCKILNYADLPNPFNKNTYPTKELAEASLALCQLLRHRDDWNGAWVPDWKDAYSKYTIKTEKNNLRVWRTQYISHVLSFPTEKLANEFLNEFRLLLEIAKPLL